MAGVFASCTQDGAGVATPLEISAEIGNPQTRADDPHLSDYDTKKFVTDDVIKISKTVFKTGMETCAAGHYPQTDIGTFTIRHIGVYQNPTCQYISQ